jgi:hypothetical protein
VKAATSYGKNNQLTKVKGMYKYKVITWSETATSYDKNNERLPMQVEMYPEGKKEHLVLDHEWQLSRSSQPYVSSASFVLMNLYE